MKRILILMIIGIFTMNISAQTETFCRFEKNGLAYYGKVENGKILQLKNAPWLGIELTGQIFDLGDVKLLYPSEPTKIFGLVKSYRQAWKEKPAPKFVRWFIKPYSSAASENEDIILPSAFDEVKVECELVIVIGRKVKNADENDAAKAIFGYTVGNDIMGFDESFVKKSGDSEDYKDASLAAGLKIGDGFAPYGPFLVTGIEWRNRNFTLSITNKDTGKNIVYKDSTENLLYSPAKIVSDLSKVLELNPGDVIFSGTSKSIIAGANDVVTVGIEGVSKITNRIKKAECN